MNVDQIQTYELRIKELICSDLCDDYNLDIRVQEFGRPEYLARQLVASMRIPAAVLQEDRMIASYPDGLWQYIRSACGLPFRVREVRLTEYLLFPNVSIPPGMQDKVRLFVQPSVTTYDPWRSS